MRRRDFMALFAGAAVLGPLGVRAQAPANRPARIGLFRYSPTPQRYVDALRRGLADKGYAEGRGFVFVTRFGNGDPQELPALAAALVADNVDVIVTEGNTITQAALDVTTTIPIVMAGSPEPQRFGLIANLTQPGGNVTGLSSQHYEATGKRLEFAKDMVPALSRVAVLAGPRAWSMFGDETLAAARKLGLSIVHIELAATDFDPSLRQAVAANTQFAVVIGRPLFSTELMKSLVERANGLRLPTAYETRDFVEFGGLMSFGVDTADLYRRAGTYIDRIVKGAKPADLPVEQPTKFELVVNLRAAKAFGIDIPPSILARADEVIE